MRRKTFYIGQVVKIREDLGFLKNRDTWEYSLTGTMRKMAGNVHTIVDKEDHAFILDNMGAYAWEPDWLVPYKEITITLEKELFEI